MAVTEEIKVSIVGDASGFEEAAKKCENASAHISDSLKETAKTVEQAGITWREFVGQRMGAYMKEMGSHGAAIKKIGEEWRAYKAGLETIPPVQKEVTQAAARLNQALAGTKRPTTDASQALLNLNRIVQDAPYGFMGISNNLNPALESLQQLSKESKAAGVSMGSILLKSLTGPAGLGIALAAVTSAISFAQMGFAMWTRGMHGASAAAKTNADQIKEAREALDKYVSSLNDVRQAQVRGAQSAQDELVKLQTLYNATQDANIPLANRKKLVDELQQQYPKYFANIKDETILAGGATTAYNLLSEAIMASAKARAAQDSLVDIQKQVLAVEEKIADAKTNEETTYKKIAEQQAKLKASIDGATASQRASESFAVRQYNQTKNITQAQEDYKKSISESAKLVGDRNKLLERAQNLVKSITDITEENPDSLIKPSSKEPKAPKAEAAKFNFFDHYFDLNPKTASEKAKQAAEMYKTALEYAVKYQDSIVGLDELVKEPNQAKTLEKAKKVWSDIQKGLVQFKPPVINLEQEIKLIPKVNDLDFQSTLRNQFLNTAGAQGEGKTTLPLKAELDFGDFTENYQKKFKALGRNLNVSQFLAPKDEIPKLYENLNAQIQKSAELVSGTLAPAFQNLFGAILEGEDPLKAFFQGIGQQIAQLISQLIAAAVQALVLSAITGGGTSFASAFGKIVGFKPAGMATGGIVPGGFPNDTFPAMLSSGEAVIPLHQLSNLVSSMGNAQPSVVVMSQRLRGRDIYLQQTRERAAQRRGG